MANEGQRRRQRRKQQPFFQGIIGSKDYARVLRPGKLMQQDDQEKGFAENLLGFKRCLKSDGWNETTHRNRKMNDRRHLLIPQITHSSHATFLRLLIS
jgi:hypothetical protein